MAMKASKVRLKNNSRDHFIYMSILKMIGHNDTKNIYLNKDRLRKTQICTCQTKTLKEVLQIRYSLSKVSAGFNNHYTSSQHNHKWAVLLTSPQMQEKMVFVIVEL